MIRVFVVACGVVATSVRNLHTDLVQHQASHSNWISREAIDNDDSDRAQHIARVEAAPSSRHDPAKEVEDAMHGANLQPGFDSKKEEETTRGDSEAQFLAAIDTQKDMGDSFKPSGRVAVVHNIYGFYPAMFTGIFQIQSAMQEFSSVADHIVMMPNTTDLELQKSVESICNSIGVTHTIFYDVPEIRKNVSGFAGNLVKLYVLNLDTYVKGYDKAVYLDVDVVAMTHFDSVFAYPSLSMAFWQNAQVFNGGVMVFEPAKIDFHCVLSNVEQFAARSSENKSHDWYTNGYADDDQRFLAVSLASRGCGTAGVLELPERFNVRSYDYSGDFNMNSMRGWLGKTFPKYIHQTATFVHLTLHKPFFAVEGTKRILDLHEDGALVTDAVCRSMNAYEAVFRRFPQVLEFSRVTESALKKRGSRRTKVEYLGPDYIDTFVKNDQATNLRAWRSSNCKALGQGR